MKPCFALLGAPNCGKTTLFNRLTGLRLAVGNRPGVTVGAQTGPLFLDGREAVLADLPGTYSLCPQGRDEQAAVRFLQTAAPDAVACVVRADGLARGLYLALEVLEWGVPAVIALTMEDVLRRQGGRVDAARLSADLGVPVVSVGDAPGQRALTEALFSLAARPVRPPFPDYGGPVQQTLRAAAALFPGAEGPFWAVRALEGDKQALDRLPHSGRARLSGLAEALGDRLGRDAMMGVIGARYDLCDALALACLRGKRRPEGEPGALRRLVLSPYLAYGWLLGLPALLFFLIFGPPGRFLTEAVQAGAAWAFSAAQGVLAGAPEGVRSLAEDCFFVQLQSLLGFLPQIGLMAAAMAVLEDSGLMAHLAVPADRVMRRCGLNGGAFIPLLMGYGCTVPALLAVRSLPDADDRRRLRHLLPLVPCGARLPMLGLLSGLFFGKRAGLVLGLVLFLSIFLVFSLGRALGGSGDRGFLMELPLWHLPRGVLRRSGERCAAFLRKVGAVVLVAGVPLWALQRFGPSGTLAADPSGSILAAAGRSLAPVLAPLGLDRWQAVTSLLCGLMAKESSVAALTVLCGGEAGIRALFSPGDALVYLTFFSLYTPCVAAVATHLRESEQPGHTLLAVLHGLLTAYAAAGAVRLACALCGKLFL